MSRFTTFVIIIIIAVVAFVGWQWRHAPFFQRLFGTTQEGQLAAEVHYACNSGKTLDATVYNGQPSASTAGQPPQPTGSATVVLSDGRTMSLTQTLSADGARYSNGDPNKNQGEQGAETFVFWAKGNGALVLENNVEKSYIGCVKVADDPGGLPQVYQNGTGFTMRYPSGYTPDENYVYQDLGPGKSIAGAKFTIDPAFATGTNLSSDTYISVEELASTTECTADKFLADAPSPTQWSDGSMTYSYASSTGAAAGNRYEEQVFALPGTNPCIAVRYFIHSGAIENYPTGAVKEFNHDSLVAQFDAIRKTLVVNQ